MNMAGVTIRSTHEILMEMYNKASATRKYWLALEKEAIIQAGKDKQDAYFDEIFKRVSDESEQKSNNESRYNEQEIEGIAARFSLNTDYLKAVNKGVKMGYTGVGFAINGVKTQ